MKLYATVTSERASKGQGGHKRLDIVLTCKDEERGTYDEVGKLTMHQATGGAINMLFRSLVSEEDLHVQLPTRYNTKGKKQKGESFKCDRCEFDGATSKELHEHRQDQHGLEIA